MARTIQWDKFSFLVLSTSLCLPENTAAAAYAAVSSVYTTCLGLGLYSFWLLKGRFVWHPRVTDMLLVQERALNLAGKSRTDTGLDLTQLRKPILGIIG